MSETSNTSDYVTVANQSTVTEAHLIQGALRAGGLDAHVPDANISQAHSLMTVALGGVRVVVPADQLDAAREILKALDDGKLQLDVDEGHAPSASAKMVLTSPVFSPDRALLLSILFTPVFAIGIQIANARVLQRSSGTAAQWVTFTVLAAISASVVLMVHGMNAGPFVVFRASPVLLVFTLSWYFFLGGQSQSRALIDTYGPRYPRRSFVVPSLIAAAICLLSGWTLDQFLF